MFSPAKIVLIMAIANIGYQIAFPADPDATVKKPASQLEG
jgi:hypothetical protein